MCLEVTVNRIMHDVCARAYEPFIERRFRVVQYLVPLFVPFQFRGFISPETFQVFFGFLCQRVPIFQARLHHNLLRWIIDFAFHFLFLRHACLLS